MDRVAGGRQALITSFNPLEMAYFGFVEGFRCTKNTSKNRQSNFMLKFPVRDDRITCMVLYYKQLNLPLLSWTGEGNIS